MTQFLTWLAMGGYAVYVWTAYSTLFFMIFIHIVVIRFQRARIWKKLEQDIKQRT